MKPKLTGAQRRCLFMVGAFGDTRQCGTWGRRFRREVRSRLEDLGLITFDLTRCQVVLTGPGQIRFTHEFGAPCPEHQWGAIGESMEGRYRRCPICREVHRRIRKYEMASPLLLWERETLEAIARGDHTYFSGGRDDLYGDIARDQRRRARHLLIVDDLIDMDGMTLTELGGRCLATNGLLTKEEKTP